jgi:stage III sporulation protein AG
VTKVLDRLSDKQKKLVSWLAIAVLIVVGFLMVQPPKQQFGTPTQAETKNSSNLDFAAEAQYIEKRLSELLSAVAGIRRADVFVTLERGTRLNIAEESTYEQRNNAETRRTTTPALVRSGQSESPIVLEETWPQIRGVLVVADGADDPQVRFTIAHAVQTVLQIEMYRIEVLPRN